MSTTTLVRACGVPPKRSWTTLPHVIPQVLTEIERAETLNTLEQKNAELEAAWRKLPLKIETDGQKKRQQEIITKIKEIQATIELFGRPRVVVKLDE